MKKHVVIFFLLIIGLVGCGEKRIMGPMSMGFAPGEFVSISAITDDDLGHLYYAFSSNSSVLVSLDDLEWTRSPYNLFPPVESSTEGNPIHLYEEHMVRSFIQEYKAGGGFNAPVVNMKGVGEGLFKYNSQTKGFYKLSTLSYNPEALEHVNLIRQIAEDRRAQGETVYAHFAYIDLIYQGTAVLERYNKFESDSKVNSGISINWNSYNNVGETFLKDGNVMMRLARHMILSPSSTDDNSSSSKSQKSAKGVESILTDPRYKPMSPKLLKQFRDKGATYKQKLNSP